ncbi:MAG: hypothetical protein ACTSWR_10880 [Candidatus Helarchaeota archaeon]
MILRLIFEFHAPYKGYPLYISANAFRHMIGMSVNSSFGFFTTSPLNCPKIYEEYFFEKKVSQLLLPHFYYRRSRMGNLAKIIPIFFPKYVTFDIFGTEDELKHIINRIKSLKLMQLGGCRNLGYGVVTLHSFFMFKLENIQVPEQGTHAVLISPCSKIPKYFIKYNCRQDKEVLWNNGTKRIITIVPRGQFFRLKPGTNIKIAAIDGILRKYDPLGKIGYGEYIIVNWEKRRG